jgi:hypothetical protein
MNDLAFLQYMFLFEPTSTWQHLSQFEGDLADFFRANGMEAQVVKTVGGQIGQRILYIKPLTNITTPVSKVESGMTEKTKSGRPISLKTQIKNLTYRPMRKAAQDFIKHK